MPVSSQHAMGAPQRTLALSGEEKEPGWQWWREDLLCSPQRDLGVECTAWKWASF